MTERELSIKIKIADREYPMRIGLSEEERLRTAGKLINEKLKKYRDQFGIDDKQDLLAMVAFDACVELLKRDSELSEFSVKTESQLEELNIKINRALTS